MERRIQSRAETGLRRPEHVNRIPTPSPRLWGHHTAVPWYGHSGLRKTQDFHMDTRDWSDIAYSFLIDWENDHAVYEGRGAGVAGGHTQGDNSRSHAICAMGDFTKLPATDELVDQFGWLVAHGVLSGWWTGLTGGHNDAVKLGFSTGKGTACPGNHLYQRIPDIREAAKAHVLGTAPLPPIIEKVPPMYEPAIKMEPIVDSYAPVSGGVYLLAASGAVYAFGAPYKGGANGQPYFRGRKAARIGPSQIKGKTYAIKASSGEVYDY